MIDSNIENDEGLAWPSYVDFMFSFCFILVLSLGYMVFISVRDVEGQDFQREAKEGTKVFEEKMKITPVVHWDQRTIEIPLNKLISFDIGCPGKLTCQKELSGDQKSKLRDIAKLFSEQFGAAHTIHLRGQTDSQQGSDKFVNFRLGNERALAVYKFFDSCASDCGLDKSAGGSLRKVQLANVGDTLAGATSSSAEDRTVTIILDYSSK